MADKSNADQKDESVVTLAHGAGGGAMRSLLDDLVVPQFAGDGESTVTEPAVGLPELDDGAVHPVGDGAIVVTTDSHVVSPRFFPGGDIGKLAVAGTGLDSSRAATLASLPSPGRSTTWP